MIAKIVVVAITGLFALAGYGTPGRPDDATTWWLIAKSLSCAFIYGYFGYHASRDLLKTLGVSVP